MERVMVHDVIRSSTILQLTDYHNGEKKNGRPTTTTGREGFSGRDKGSKTINGPVVAVAGGAAARAPWQPHHATTWFTAHHPHVSMPFLVGEILASPFSKGRGSASSPQLP